MNPRIECALTRLFDRHRIIFWYDAKKELRRDFETQELPGVEKIELTNNEFGVKHRILREQPDQKFLLYKEGPAPADLGNWLLDVQLAHEVFNADQAGLWLSELGLGVEMASIVREHPEFYITGAGKQLKALRNLLSPQDTEGMIRLKMLAVCAGADSRLDNILENLLAELAVRKGDKIKLIARCNLEAFLWEQLQRNYGYNSAVPGIEDFAIELFKSCYAMATGGTVKLNNDALVFLKRWKDSRRFETSFETLSNEYASVLSIEADLNGRDFRDLIDIDYFRIVDQKIVSDLVRAVETRIISAGECTQLIRQRRQSHWHGEFLHIYEAVDAAAQFVHALDAANLTVTSLQEGVERYSQSWFRLDQLYRRFIYHMRSSGEASLLGSLTNQVENLYTNNYLLKLNGSWQVRVDAAEKWQVPGVVAQNHFFETWVQPVLSSKKKVFVIVSDAMRYETGEELLSLMRP